MAVNHKASIYPLKKEKLGVGKPPIPLEVILITGHELSGKRKIANMIKSDFVLSENDYRVNKYGVYVYSESDTNDVYDKLFNQYTKWLSYKRNPIVIHSEFKGNRLIDFMKSAKIYGYNINLLTTTNTR